MTIELNEFDKQGYEEGPTLAKQMPNRSVDLRRGEVKEAALDVIDLGIDWNSLNKKEIFEKLAAYGTAGEGVFYKCEVPTGNGEKLELQFTKTKKSWRGSDDALGINLVRPTISAGNWPKHYIATFDFARFGSEWNMKHRETGNLYRRQGIAGEVLKLFEDYLRGRPETQEISAEVAQPELIDWLEKRQYVPATQEDVTKLERLKAKDPNIIVLSMPKKGEKYLFDRKAFRNKFNFEATDLKIWKTKFYNEDFFYMKSSFRIKFKKSIKA